MKIACLGWGSLVWDPGGLPVEEKCWHKDGPMASVEFTRKSKNGRMTLVIEPNATPVPLLWNIMTSSDLKLAEEALRVREDTLQSNIGTWLRGLPSPEAIPNLAQWANEREVDAVVWTALGPKFCALNDSPSIEQVVEYLGGLTGKTRTIAERYIRCAPKQIDTEYRRRIIAVLGWDSRGLRGRVAGLLCPGDVRA